MLSIPEWLIVALALGSAVEVAPTFGGKAKALARLWVAGFYLFIWLGPDIHDMPFWAALSRIGLGLIFATDIIPAIINRYKLSKGGK